MHDIEPISSKDYKSEDNISVTREIFINEDGGVYVKYSCGGGYRVETLPMMVYDPNTITEEEILSNFAEKLSRLDQQVPKQITDHD